MEPFFLDNDNVANDLKINFHLELALTCADSWVRHPAHLDLMFTARNFAVFVDPTGLEPGVHSTYVQAFDVKQVCSDASPACRWPNQLLRDLDSPNATK